jgi:hypothetical protein
MCPTLSLCPAVELPMILPLILMSFCIYFYSFLLPGNKVQFNRIMQTGILVAGKWHAVKALLTYPEFPDTFWSFRHALNSSTERRAVHRWDC